MKIFTDKSMDKDIACVFGSKCAVYGKSVTNEIEKLEIRCTNHPDIFSHVKCDPALKISIRLLKQRMKQRLCLEYSCPSCKSNKRIRKN